jgi:hypothetical protein
MRNSDSIIVAQQNQIEEQKKEDSGGAGKCRYEQEKTGRS